VGRQTAGLIVKAALDISSFKKSIKAHTYPTADKMQKIADKAKRQVDDRFASGGSSGDATWPPGKMPMGKKPPLGGLQDTYKATAKESQAVVATPSWIALVHHLGTTGKGGILATIVPRYAKALYIPLTPLGITSYEARKMQAPVMKTVFAGLPYIEKPKWSHELFGGGEAKQGIDFIFLKRVDLPPRRQLPTSSHEIAALSRLAVKILAGIK